MKPFIHLLRKAQLKGGKKHTPMTVTPVTMQSLDFYL